jgi:hypothetical protein
MQMKKWQVTLKNVHVVVEATDLTITSSGALMFSVSGEIRHVFAHGHWTNAVLLDGGRHGYR